MPFRILAPLVLGGAVALVASSIGLAQTRNQGTKQPEKQRDFFYIPGTDTVSPYRVVKTYPANNRPARVECARWQGRLVKVSATEYQCRKPVEYVKPPSK
jgi:hypothetical protein